MPARPMMDLPLLTPKEELEMGEFVVAGRRAEELLHDPKTPAAPDDREVLEAKVRLGEAAVTRLVEHNQRLVDHAAKDFKWHSDYDDLLGAGGEGLTVAAQTFNPAKGKFSTWALLIIRQRMYRVLDDRIIGVPATYLQENRKVEETRRLLFMRLKREPTNVEVANHLGIQLQRLEELELIPKVAASLDAPVRGGDEPGTHSLQDTLVDWDEVARREAAENRETAADCVAQMLEVLTAEERMVLAARFGLGGQEVRTLETLGSELGVGKDTVRRIEGRALAKLRHPAAPPAVRQLLREII